MNTQGTQRCCFISRYALLSRGCALVFFARLLILAARLFSATGHSPAIDCTLETFGVGSLVVCLRGFEKRKPWTKWAVVFCGAFCLAQDLYLLWTEPFSASDVLLGPLQTLMIGAIAFRWALYFR